MSHLAPGRTHDMAMLLQRRDAAAWNSYEWRKCQAKIEDLVAEGKCQTVVNLRYRLVGASKAHDEAVVENVSRLIEEHVKSKHPKRFYREWAKG